MRIFLTGTTKMAVADLIRSEDPLQA